MIKLFFTTSMFFIFTLNVLAGPFTQSIGIIEEIVKQPTPEEVIEVTEEIKEQEIPEDVEEEKTIVEVIKDEVINNEEVLTSKVINADPLTAYPLKNYILKGIATRKSKEQKNKFTRIKISNYDYGKIPTIHTIQKDENLDLIAFRYGFSVKEIQIPNALVPGTNKLIVGSKLIIPSRFHRIKESETIESISKIYNLDPHTVAVYNELEKEEAIIIGRKLLLPFFMHVTRKVVYLKNIAKLYDREIEELLEINNLESKNYTLIQENQLIKIPIHINKNYTYENLNKKSINDYFINIRNLGIVEINGSQFMIREGDKIGDKDGVAVSIFNKKMVVLENNMEFEFFINTPITSQSFVSLANNQEVVSNQNINISNSNNDIPNSEDAVNNTNVADDTSTNVEDLFN